MMTRLLDRIRVWANTHYRPSWNLIATVAMMALASLFYELELYQKSAILYASATVPVMLATAHFAMRYEEMRQGRLKRENDEQCNEPCMV